jgi:hypothetical protein
VKQQSGDMHPLPVRRAFVVQFGAETAVGQQRFVGRVEHVVSGQATHFATLEKLLAFMTRVLAAQDTAPEEPPDAVSP